MCFLKKEFSVCQLILFINDNKRRSGVAVRRSNRENRAVAPGAVAVNQTAMHHASCSSSLDGNLEWPCRADEKGSRMRCICCIYSSAIVRLQTAEWPSSHMLFTLISREVGLRIIMDVLVTVDTNIPHELDALLLSTATRLRRHQKSGAYCSR